MNTQHISLDVSKRHASFQEVSIGMGDSNGTILECAIFDNGAYVDLDGLDCFFEMLLPDGEHMYRQECTVDGNVATVVIDESRAASAVGVTKTAYISIEDGDALIASTSRFTVRVLGSAKDAEPAETWASDISDALDEVNQLAEIMSDIGPLTNGQIDDVADDETVTSDKYLSGTGLTRLWAKIKAKFATIAHTHSASDVNDGQVSIEHGGTGASTASAARTALDAAAATHTHEAGDISSGQLAVANGGTSKSSADDARSYLGNIPLAESTTAASTAAKTASLSGFELFAGVRVAVKFTNANTYDSGALTLSVNSTTAKTIYVKGSSTSSTNKLTWAADDILEFFYDGSYWHFLGKANQQKALESDLASVRESVSRDYQTFLVSNTLSLFCIGNTVCLSGYIDNATFSTGDTIATIPAGYRPKYSLQSVLVRVSGSISIAAIGNGGAVKIYTNVSGGRIDIYASWGIL